MLSKTAETKPRPKAVCHDAEGSSLTGISDAHQTSESRNTHPLSAPGISPQAGFRRSEPTRIAAHTPYQGPPAKKPAHGPLNIAFAKIAAARIRATIPSWAQSIGLRSRDGLVTIGWIRFCAAEARRPQTRRATTHAMKPRATAATLTPESHIMVVVVSPTTLHAPPALLAATMAATKPMDTFPW